MIVHILDFNALVDRDGEVDYYIDKSKDVYLEKMFTGCNNLNLTKLILR